MATIRLTLSEIQDLEDRVRVLMDEYEGDSRRQAFFRATLYVMLNRQEMNIAKARDIRAMHVRPTTA